MSDLVFKPFGLQKEFIQSTDRVAGGFAGKRGGKTEGGAIRAVIYTENQIGFKDNGRDPYRGAIIAPTWDMMKRLSMKKFMAFAKPFNPEFSKASQSVLWDNGAEVQGVSADKPERFEGDKLNWVWIDEVFQCPEQIFDEAIARVADNEGFIWLTGSLGVQYANPKNHWVYHRLKLKPMANSRTWEWPTAANPYFPRAELDRLRDTLDPLSYRQMFTLTWDSIATAAVYGDFSDANLVKGYVYNPALETSVCIDWGWNHPMAIGFFQYDHRYDRVVLFDEIVKSRMTLEQAWDQIKAKNYNIRNWFCDISGTQEREQTAKSNVQWFKKNHDITFKYRAKAINYGIPIVRSYILNGMGQRKFYIDELRCPKSVDGLRNYSYPEKDGMITDENPIKKDDDAPDMIRYYFVNRHDINLPTETMKDFSRWGMLK